jgi:hypothetical protein
MVCSVFCFVVLCHVTNTYYELDWINSERVINIHPYFGTKKTLVSRTSLATASLWIRGKDRIAST